MLSYAQGTVKCSADTDLVLTSVPCCQALYRLSPYYQFGNGYMEILSWWLKTHSGVGTQLSSSRPMLWYTPPLTLRGQVCQVGCARGTRLVQGPWLLHTGPVLPSALTTPLTSLEGLVLFCFCAFYPTAAAAWAEAECLALYCFHCVLIWSRAHLPPGGRMGIQNSSYLSEPWYKSYFHLFWAWGQL